MIDIVKVRDNFQGTEEELNNIAHTIYDCVDATNGDPDSFIDECWSMLLCDYDWLHKHQQDNVIDIIVEIIEEL